MNLKCSTCGCLNKEESFNDDGQTYYVMEREVWSGIILTLCTSCFSELIRAKYNSPAYLKYLADYAMGEMIERIPMPHPPLLGVGNWEEMRERIVTKMTENNARIYSGAADVAKDIRAAISQLYNKYHEQEREEE